MTGRRRCTGRGERLDTMPAASVLFAIDIAVAAALCYAATEAFRCWTLLHAGYWRLAATGLAVLALDELLGLHEAIGWAIASLGAPAPWHTSHWDDVVLAGYVLIAAAISLAQLGELRRSRRAFALLALGFGLAALAVLLDNLAQSPGGAIGQLGAVEELLELAGAVVIAMAMRVRRIEASSVSLMRRSPRARAGAEVIPG